MISEARAALSAPGAVTEVAIESVPECLQVTLVVTLGSEALTELFFHELRSAAGATGGLRLGPLMLGAQFVEAEDAPPS